ncbi:MAG: glycoside hydrolase family 57 protein [Steroidobacteraceae bacterium]
MTEGRLPVVFLWHMHQPPYRDALSGRYILPWTYLHAIKDYTDMAAHLEAQPGAKAVVNFTPVLIEQIEELAARVQESLAGGRPPPDALLATLSGEPLPAEEAQRLALLRACLKADATHLIGRHPRFGELAAIAATVGTPELISYVSDAFLHDLSMWYHLAWLGESVRRGDARVAQLADKGRGFGAADRRLLLELIGELLSGILPRYRRLADAGRCELAVSPYSHPILPLLIDFGAARESEPHAALPLYSSYPGGAARATWHMEEALRCFERVFGRRPRGCWPSEGAISNAAVDAIDAAGFDWFATSAGVLRGSLEKSDIAIADEPAAQERQLNRAHALPGRRVAGFFRQEMLSDLIGFTYSKWHGDDAAAHFVGELEAVEVRTRGEPGRVLLVALDGENAWEHYPFNGHYFLSALYASLAAHARLRMATLAEVVDEQRAAQLAPVSLPQVRAGSWVYGTLSTWMGDADKNRGWDLLCEAKLAFDQAVAAGRLAAADLERATRQLAACEASDWFWWFGDYNPSGAVRDFDELYRHQLASLYRALGLDPSAALEQPISVGRGEPEGGGVMRRA